MYYLYIKYILGMIVLAPTSPDGPVGMCESLMFVVKLQQLVMFRSHHREGRGIRNKAVTIGNDS